MRESWLELVGCVLRPARPRLDWCLRAREPHLASRRRFAEERAQALAACEARIESARTAVFEAKDGVVSSRMTDLEREWRMLSRPDPDFGVMDLWARIAPAAWIDRKRWRSADRAAQTDLAIALAADVAGVEEAESAASALRVALLPWGPSMGTRTRWRLSEEDFEGTTELLAEPLRAACEALSAGGASRRARRVLERAQELEREVHEAATIRLPKRAVLARAVAHAAFVDCVWRATPVDGHSNPVGPLLRLWGSGYVLSAVDALGVTLAAPPLPPDDIVVLDSDHGVSGTVTRARRAP